MSADEPVGLTRCPSSRSRQLRSPWGIDSCRSLKSAFIAIRVAVSGRLVLPGTLPRTALTRRAQPSPHHVRSIPRKGCILVFVRRLWASLVFYELAAVARSNANHRLPLIAQSLGLGRLGVALTVFGGSPAKRQVRAGALAVTLSSAELVLVVIQPRLTSAMAIANGEHPRRVASARSSD